MMEVVEFFRGHPFLLGLAVGFIAVLFVWVRGLLRCRSLNREMARLKESLYTKMQIDAKGYMTRESELEQLKKENENLRITVKSLQNKPGRAEIRQLHVYDKAIHSMLARAPGFAPTWEMVLKRRKKRSPGPTPASPPSCARSSSPGSRSPQEKTSRSSSTTGMKRTSRYHLS